MIEEAGYPVAVVPLEQASPEGDADAAVQMIYGSGPVMDWAEAGTSRRRQTIVFLDTPASAMAEMLAANPDPMKAARTMTATLAPLAPILREEKPLLVDRELAEQPEVCRPRSRRTSRPCCRLPRNP